MYRKKSVFKEYCNDVNVSLHGDKIDIRISLVTFLFFCLHYTNR